MTTMVYIVLGIPVWYLVGFVVLDSIDTPERDLLWWYQSCPEEIAWFAQPLALTLWPVVAAVFLYSRSKEQHMSAERNTLRVLIEAFDDGLEIDVDRGSGWDPWQGNHYNKSWGFRINYPEGWVAEVQTKE